MTTLKTKTKHNQKPFSWAVPEALGVPPDPLRLRLDFHHQAVTLTSFDGDVVDTRLVSAMAVAHALASELSFGTGLLPDNTLWWCNAPQGPVTAIYAEPQVWKVALQLSLEKQARRFEVPLPGLVFLCSSGRPPWVYAVKQKPRDEADQVYKAPLCNVFADGRSCPGSHSYPEDVRETVRSFFLSFFSVAGDLRDRSRRFPGSVVHLWEFLDKKKRFPMDDLVEYCTIHDLMRMELR